METGLPSFGKMEVPESYYTESSQNCFAYEELVKPQYQHQLVPVTITTPLPYCQVCGDKSSGRNFGVFTCNGCRSFFRRTVRENRKFTCKYGGNCEIRVKARLHCRACRYAKSLRVGMEPQSVFLPENCLIDILEGFLPSPKATNSSYNMLQSFRQAEIQLDSKFAPYFPKTNLKVLQDMQELQGSLSTILRYVVEWAKMIEIFQEFDVQTKVALLRAHCTELIHLETARLSLEPQPGDGEYIYGAGLKIPGRTKGVTSQTFNELIIPCRRMKVSDEEFWCLKALVLFNPNTEGLSEKDRDGVGNFQYKVRQMLETILENDKAKIFDLFMLMPTVGCVAEQLRRSVRNSRNSNIVKSCKLLEDLV